VESEPEYSYKKSEPGVENIDAIELLRLQTELAKSEVTGLEPKIHLPHPLSVCFSVIDKCDRSCKHCMSSSNLHASNGMDTKHVKTMFSKLKDSGVMRIDIVGGEPFLRSDILELTEYANDISLRPTITTHGGLITQEIAEELAKLGVTVQVSIDGDYEQNDRLRGRGSYHAAVRGMHLLSQNRVPLRISCTIQKSNGNAFEHALDLAKEVGAKSVYVNFICAQGRAGVLRDRISLTSEEEMTVRVNVRNLASESQENERLIEMKQADRGGVFISSNGDFHSQAQFEEDRNYFGNIFYNDIREMWQSTNINHRIHLLQYLQHPLMYKPLTYS